MAQASTGIDNAQRMRKGYDAFQRGDLDALRELFNPDIVWHNPGNNPLSGDYRGVDAVFGLFMKVFEETGGTLKNELHDVLANDTHAVALVRVTAERNGKSFTGNAIHVTHPDSEGRVAESWYVPEDARKADEFWA